MSEVYFNHSSIRTRAGATSESVVNGVIICDWSVLKYESLIH